MVDGLAHQMALPVPDIVVRSRASVCRAARPAEIREEAESLRESGIGYLYCGWPGAGRDQVERFATEVLPALRT